MRSSSLFLVLFYYYYSPFPCLYVCLCASVSLSLWKDTDKSFKIKNLKKCRDTNTRQKNVSLMKNKIKIKKLLHRLWLLKDDNFPLCLPWRELNLYLILIAPWNVSLYEHTKGWQLNLLHRKALLVLIFDNYLLVHVFFCAWVHASHSLSHHKQINFVEELMIADLFQRD